MRYVNFMKMTVEEESNISGEGKINPIEKGFQSLKIDLSKEFDILDAGGTFYTYVVLSRIFPKSKITTMNILPESEFTGCKRYIKCDAQKFELNEKFDIIITTDMIEHLVFPDSFFECSYKHLNPGGLLVITTPNLACWYNRIFLLFGYSLPNYNASTRHRTGNPFIRPTPNEHKSVFTFKGLKDSLSIYKFKTIYSAGYYYGSKHYGTLRMDGKFYNLRKFSNLILPTTLREGILLIAKK